TLSQVTEFEEEGINSPFILHSSKQQQQLQLQLQPPPSQPVGHDQDRGRTQSRSAVPGSRATSGSPRLRSLRPSALKIQIPSYPTMAVGRAKTTLVTTQPSQTQPQQFAFPIPPSNTTVPSQQPLRIITNPEHPSQL